MNVLRTVTPLGWLVLTGSAAAWLAGARLGWDELVLAGATGLLVLAISVLLAIGATVLTVEVHMERWRLRAGEATSGQVRLVNGARRRLLPVTLELQVGPAREAFSVPALRPGAAFAGGFGVACARRGVVAVGPATTVRGDPFGLLRRTVSWTDTRELLVHPVTVALDPLGAGLLRDLEGRPTNDISASDLAFHALREYVPGDDRRYIHWRSSAKLGAGRPGGTLLVRQFVDTRRAHLTVIVDGNPASYADSGEFETAISAAASVAWRAFSDKLDLTVVAADQRPAVGAGAMVLDGFARAGFVAAPVSELVGRAVNVAANTSIALLATGSAATLAELRRASTQFAPEVRVVLLWVKPSAHAQVCAVGEHTVLTLRELADLPALLREGLR